jgi:hypothetical protein
MRPQHTDPDWYLHWSFPTSYTFFVTLSDMQRQRHLMFEAPVCQALSNFAIF